jgi:hypothetical protein
MGAHFLLYAIFSQKHGKSEGEMVFLPESLATLDEKAGNESKLLEMR